MPLADRHVHRVATRPAVPQRALFPRRAGRHTGRFEPSGDADGSAAAALCGGGGENVGVDLNS
jgi:hypothetical protein